MRIFAGVIGSALAAIMVALPARADDGVRTSRGVAFIGDQFEIVVEVSAPPGASVDIDPVAPSWAGVEIVRMVSSESTPSGDVVVHRLRLVVASFLPGESLVTPSVLVTEGVDVRTVEVPGFRLTVTATLPPDAALELSPISPPGPIGGGESPWLRPAIAAGVITGVTLVSGLVLLVVRALLRRRPARSVPQPELMPVPDLGAAESLLETDPVRAYRALGTVVRSEIGQRYGFPANALTTRELQSRMEAEGVERWQARLVSGLLQECDAVVYAGYRPAIERRFADLTTAREIVGANA